MFITSREKMIIDLIVKTSGKHTVHSLSTFLEVSARTVQRDLKSIEKLLKPFELELKRTATEGLFIDGKNEQIYRLIQRLTGVNPTDITPEQRKLQLLIMLLHDGPTFKKQVLARQLGISGATLSLYLDDLTDWFHKFSINLTRKRGVGLELVGTESSIRHALANYFLVHFYEDLIESFYFLGQGNWSNKNILGYFSPRYLVVIDELVNQKINKEQTRLADNDYTGLIVYICITLQRIEHHFLLEQEIEAEHDYTSEFNLVSAICEKLQGQLSIPLEKSDVHFLTVVLKGSKLQAADVAGYDSVLLGKLIKNVIQDVSEQLNVHLMDDFSLYQGLLAHMEPSIFRLKQKLDLFNPLTNEIKRKYSVLFMVVQKSLDKQFEDVHFPDDEIAFIVLHFGSALVKREESIQVHAVIVCPTGIGTSKMLASRVQKELSEIHNVEILSIKEFQKADLNEYELVISTVRLPFADVDYILVSPLLSEKDIHSIQDYLQKHLEVVTRKKSYVTTSIEKDANQKNNRQDVKGLLKEIQDVHSSMESILANLRVYWKQSDEGHWRVIEEMVEESGQSGLVTNPTNVIKELEEREKNGGLGIPNTNMGLFHCREESVSELIFQVAHLNKPCTIKGMDGRDMQMKNLLLMLAPKHMSKREQEVLSMISTSLIENDIAMMIFSSSNEGMIRKKLEDTFFDYLQNNLIKE
ncbi:BglG family transcription antiterminator [Halalkalibacter sp. AB-rgal2]|uniref:BglG family transcription antiterminator n=1 Tax=Halalkalibacter sp. AB-rgal2 TaxID=3242695 RepID=UPI00359E3083